MWAFLLLMPLASAEANSATTILWISLLPPYGLPLYIAIAIFAVGRRVWTRVDERGLTHQGIFKRQWMAWEDVGAIGGKRARDGVRARDGRTIELWNMFTADPNLARRELRAEIRRRAPRAQGDRENGRIGRDLHPQLRQIELQTVEFCRLPDGVAA